MTLKELITIRNMTIKQFAEFNGINHRTLEAYTSGRRSLKTAPADFVSKIAGGLHISSDDLLQEIYDLDNTRRDNMSDTAYDTDRSYLFGQLMAIHEHTALKAEGDETQVLRLHDKYVACPKTTFAKIESTIMPGMYAKLPLPAYDAIMDAKADIISKLQEAGYTDDPLDPSYLIGYYLQRTKIASL